MEKEVSQAALKCLAAGAHELVAMYTDTALLLNACDVAAKSYAERTDAFRLSTTQGISENLRLEMEIDLSFLREELPSKYRGAAVQRICEDFIVRMIAVVDGVFEDILETVIPILEPELNEGDIEKRVRSAWQQGGNGHVKLLDYLIDKAGLKSPPGKKSTVQMVFDRYYEMREMRHALVHTGGVLSTKHLSQLKKYSERLPVELRSGSLAGAEFLKTGRVIPNVAVILSLRHWAYTTILGYMGMAFEKSLEAQDQQV